PRYDPYGVRSGDTSRAPITSAPLPPPGGYGVESTPYPSEPYRSRLDAYPQNNPTYERPGTSLPPQSRPTELPRLGPARRSQVTSSIGPAAVPPPATLACPLASALDQWITSAVQPAAMRWFGQPVAEIKQISAYSCRGMNGQSGAQISEHAFGNALDIAAF